MKKLFLIAAAFSSLVLAQNSFAQRSQYLYDPSYNYNNYQTNYGRNQYSAPGTSYAAAPSNYNSFNNSAFLKHNFFIGLDGIVSNVKHTYKQRAFSSSITNDTPDDLTKDDNERYSFGINAGYRATFNGAFYLAPELFYDKIRSNANDFYFDNDTHTGPIDRMKVDYRVGLRLNVGYNFSNLVNATGMYNGFGRFLSGLSVFVNGGMARTSYNYHSPSEQFANRVITGYSIVYPNDDRFEISPIYGFGINYAITEHVAFKLAADIQQLNARYMDNGLRDSITIKTARAGLAYYF